MASLHKVVLAGVAAIGTAIGIGFTGSASAQTFHVVSVPVSGGGDVQIRYFGDVPPQVVLAPALAGFNGWMPVSSVFGHGSPFVMLDRIAGDMDRQAAAIFRYAETMADRAAAGGPAEAGLAAIPPGGERYSFVSTISGNGVCTQSVQITSRGDGTPPRVERHNSGNCGTAALRLDPSQVQPADPVPGGPTKQPDLILTQNSDGSPNSGMIRQVASMR